MVPAQVTVILPPLHTSTPKAPVRPRPGVKVPHKPPQSKPLRILNINFQCCRNKTHELDHLINSVKPDIIIGTETWLNSAIGSSEIINPSAGYDVYRKDRPNQSYGGVLIAVRNVFLSSESTELDVDCEILWVRLDMVGAKSLYIGAFYRPPSSDSAYLSHLDSSLGLGRLTHSTGCNIWLGGDFNTPHVDWDSLEVKPSAAGTRPLHQQLVDITLDHNLDQVVDQPTRGDNILDLLLTNNKTSLSKLSILPGLGKSDHDIVYAEIDVAPNRTKKPPRRIFQYKKAKWGDFKDKLLTLFDDMSQTSSTTSANDLWEALKVTLQQGMAQHIPQRTVSPKHRLPWVSHDIRKLLQHRNKVYAKWKKEKSARLSERLKSIRHDLQRKMRQSYWKYVESVIDFSGVTDTLTERATKQKKFWSFVRSLRKDSSGVAPLRSEGDLFNSATAKSDILNRQFTSVFTQEPQDRLPDKGPSPHPTMQDINITAPGIHKMLKNLKPQKAAGPDALPPTVLKELSDELAPILEHIFRRSLLTGQLPSDWKRANVAPIFKKGDKHKPENYRPVSLTCILCKCMEHIIVSNIANHLDANNILHPLQHGFRKNLSCDTQLLSLFHDLTQNTRETDLIIMDFSKAFDKVPHRRLTYKLDWYGVRGRTLDWVRDFLADRTQRVVLEGAESPLGYVMSGVPQGSVLGPILFLLYINETFCRRLYTVPPNNYTA